MKSSAIRMMLPSRATKNTLGDFPSPTSFCATFSSGSILLLRVENNPLPAPISLLLIILVQEDSTLGLPESREDPLGSRAQHPQSRDGVDSCGRSPSPPR